MRRDAIGFQVSLDVEGRHALVLGGGAEAADKAQRLSDGEAWVTVITPAPGPEVLALVEAGRAMLRQRAFLAEDAASADLVLVCEPDEELARQASRAAAETGAAFWANDRPELSQLAMPALARLGRARLAISTGGAAPALAARLRACFERDLGEEFAAFVERLGVERERLLESEPDPERRRERLRALIEGFDVHITVRYPGGRAPEPPEPP